MIERVFRLRVSIEVTRLFSFRQDLVLSRI
jgi:hypothetical protein